MKVWKVINITANDKLLECVLNYDMEQKGRVVKEILLIEDTGTYKQYKIMDVYDASISEMALNCDVFSFDTRGQLLNAQKFKGNSYYLWVDGMGLEWIDLLLKNVKLHNPEAPMPTVSVGMASMPTITCSGKYISEININSFPLFLYISRI